MELIRLPEVDIIEGEYEDVIVAKKTGMPPSAIIKAFALRVESMSAYAIAKSKESKDTSDHITFEDVCLATEVAIGMGHNPFSKDFHFWKFGGQVQIADHFAFLVGWAKGIELYRDVTEVKLIADGENRTLWYWEATCWVIRQSQETHYENMFSQTLKALVAAGIDIPKAIAAAKEAALSEFNGVSAKCDYTETYGNGDKGWYLKSKNTPKGWIPGESRAAVRALRGAIRQAYGNPSVAERANYGRINLLKLMQSVEDIPVNMDPISMGRMAELIAGEGPAMNPDTSPKERVLQLRGGEDTEIGEYFSLIPNRPLQWWEEVTGSPEEIVAAALDRANIKDDPENEKKKDARVKTTAWLVGPEIGAREARAIAWFCDALDGGKINGDRLDDFGVKPGSNASETKENLKKEMIRKLANAEFDN